MFCQKAKWKRVNISIGFVSLVLLLLSCRERQANELSMRGKFNIGREATEDEIDAWDFDISPSGAGLPRGKGTVTEGRKIYNNKCARCHGPNLNDGPYAKLVPVAGSDEKAIGNYWPYATTLYDYTMRAMPYDQPGSLSHDEVFSLCAFILYKNNLIDSMTILDSRTLPKVKMPALAKYVEDDRKGGNEIK